MYVKIQLQGTSYHVKIQNQHRRSALKQKKYILQLALITEIY